MAVYTKYNQDEIDEILSNYDLGKLETYKGIEEGIENTNYFISTKNKKYILTVYEKRVKSKDLPKPVFGLFTEIAGRTSINLFAKAIVKIKITKPNKKTPP